MEPWVEGELDRPHRKRRKRTSTVVSKAPTESKAALAGVIVETFFARVRVSMAASNAGRWELVAIVEVCGDRERVVV